MRLKYRPPRTFGMIPAPWTRLVKRRITFALLSLLFLVTCTLVAICGHENTISLATVQALDRYGGVLFETLHEANLFDILLVADTHISKDDGVLNKLLLAHDNGKANAFGFGVTELG